MELRNVKDEYREILWYMKESGEDSLSRFKSETGAEYDKALVQELVGDGLVELSGERIVLTEKGAEATRQLIRSHRLAERLVHDVLSVEYEAGACEFEHIINPDLVDSICTLLGHPRECPHGLPIPKGECCTQQTLVVESSVVPLTSLEIGETAKCAYVYSQDDRQMHKLDNLFIRPGSVIRLHQRRPSFVIECESTMIALDDDVAANIFVWSPTDTPRPVVPHGRRRRFRGFRHGL